MSNIMKKGEDVSFSVINVASGNSVVTIKDANLVARPLQVWERFILDSISWSIDGSGSGSGSVYLSDTSAGTNVIVELLSDTSDTAAVPISGFSEFPGEGISFPVGHTPFLINPYSSMATATGTGRIVNGTSQGVRPNYQCLLTPGGNVGGQ